MSEHDSPCAEVDLRFDLIDEDWAFLEPLLPKFRKSARVDDGKIMNAIFYVLRTETPWRDLPARYGPYTTAHNRFNRWSRRGIWKRVFDQLALKSRDSLYLIDSTLLKAHRADQIIAFLDQLRSPKLPVNPLSDLAFRWRVEYDGRGHKVQTKNAMSTWLPTYSPIPWMK